MKYWNSAVGLTALIACSAGIAFGSDKSSDKDCSHIECKQAVPDSIAHPDELFMRDLAGRMIFSLTPAEQKAIAAGHGIGSEMLDLSGFSFEVDRSQTAQFDRDISPSDYRDQIFPPELWERMTQGHQNMVNAIVETLESGTQPPALCFSPDMDREIAYAINQLIEFPLTIQFQQTARWSNTATDGPGLGQGDPTTITYSYVPDGTTVTNLGIGVGGGPSQLFTWLNGIYGSPATWQAHFDSVFDRWATLTGLSYVYEPNDDGANTNTLGGALGVRGDVRIAAFNFQNDGNGGVLAYNNFPQDGDMVFDAFDTFYNNTTGNSLRFRNVASHEHGHGLGMLHVCPANQTKLMEPFISTAYDGPQLDEVLNGHRHYGDPMEPNNDPFQASDLGSVGVGAFVGLGNISIDDNSDEDFFSITLTSPAQITFTASPDAATYQQGPQTQACNTGATTNYSTIHNLRVSIYTPGNIFSPAMVVDNNGTGQDESLVFDATAAGTYYIRVDASTSTNSVQRYGGLLTTATLPFLGPTISATPPTAVDPGVTTDFAVTIDPRDDTIVGGSTELFSSINGGTYTASSLTFNGGTSYTATLPAVNCGDTLDFYISAEGDIDGTLTAPASGAGSPYNAAVGTFTISFADDFESNMGWSVSGAVSGQGSGVWERGVPAGDGSRGDADSDADGSGSCFLTGNGGPGSNTDVDDGDTILTSPAFDVSGNPEATISYHRWFHNSFGNNPNIETFQVQLSDNNGSSWSALETVAGNSPESNGNWYQKTFRIADFVSTTSQVRIRFIAKDDIGAVIEAAVDGVVVAGLQCDQPADCPVDMNGDGTVNFVDVSAFVAAFSNGDPTADFNGDGQIGFPDVSAFVAAFTAGCP